MTMLGSRLNLHDTNVPDLTLLQDSDPTGDFPSFMPKLALMGPTDIFWLGAKVEPVGSTGQRVLYLIET